MARQSQLTGRAGRGIDDLKISATDTLSARIGARFIAWARAPQRRPMVHLALEVLSRLHVPDVRVLRVQARVADRLGWRSAKAFCDAKALQLAITAPLAAQDLTGVLPLMAGLERTHRAAPIAAGALIAEALITEAGRAKLLVAAQAARASNPDSAYLAHLVALCQAKQGDYRAASDDLAAALALPWRADDPLDRQRFGILRDTWRAVDLAAREHVDWAHPSEDYADLLPKTATATADPASGTPRILTFKEHALQGRRRADYLAACEADLAQAQSLAERLKAISEMLRASIRQSPSYTASYDLARGHLQGLRPEWEHLFTGPLQAETAEQTILDLCSLLQLTRQLGLEGDTARCLARFEALAEDGSHLALLWPAADEIATKARDLPLASRMMAAITARHSPQTSRHVSNFFRWALLAGAQEQAHATYAALPSRLRAQRGLLNYVQILQRESRFAEALAVTRAIHAQALAHPARLSAFSNASLIRRTGELAFLIETAEIFGRIPQPSAPKGVMLIAPRSINHLRHYPLMVLAEMKAAGWAVVPLVSGLLPIEPVGDPAIDILNGAISPNIRFSAAADAVLPQIAGFMAEPARGQLHWGEMNLSHQLWEEAAIIRRRHTIDWSCPELQRSLGSLCDWTAAMGRCLDHAHALHRRSGLRVGTMSQFNARLPDALFRFYCARHGDPDGFFYVHAANGYQNYFTNFSNNLSQRFVLRNMTRNPEARSASFPLPENFARYCAARAPEAAAVLERFQGVTAVKRSTAGQHSLSPEAEAVLARVRAWKAAGGRVACAFGKVVCDSAVPFDGGPAHTDMRDWINHCVASVQGSKTLLLIKPHPHELNNQIATFPTEYFVDLITESLGDNAVLLGHRWFDIEDMRGLVDLGLIYNGTTAVELGIMGIPCILAGYFAPTDYPIGHAVPESRAQFEALLRGLAPVIAAPDLATRAALWLEYMSSDDFMQHYCYHTRPVTNIVLYPPWWIAEDLARYAAAGGDPAVSTLLGRALGTLDEPG